MKTLYVSDLDGTLLRKNEKTSDYTNQVINELVEKGMIFSYATARSYVSAHKAAAGLNAKIPLIVYNGCMIIDNANGQMLVKNFFDQQRIQDTIEDLIQNGIYPIVYAFVDGEEKFSYIESLSYKGVVEFAATRPDRRRNPVETVEELRRGEIFYVSCIEEEEKLRPFYEKYKDEYHSVFQRDIYSKEQWLEFLPPQASKSIAIKQLKEMFGCERVVAFGDGLNDMDMFELADEAYAMSNARDELKKVATGVIGSNDEDGVANWLLERMKCIEF